MSQYEFYLNKLLLPVAPSQLKLTINNNNSTYVLIDEGQINILKKAKLSDIEFECLLPQVKYPFAVYRDGFHGAKFFLDYFEKLKTERKPFQFIVARATPSGKTLFGSDITVSMEDYKVTEQAKDGFDVTVKIKLKQYRDFSTKTYEVNVDQDKGTAAGTVEEPRPASTAGNAPDSGLPASYKVKKGDCLWNLAKKYYGDGSKYTVLAKANNISNPNLIYTGDTLTIPAI